MAILHYYHALDSVDGHRIYDEHCALMKEAAFEPDVFHVQWILPGQGFEAPTLQLLAEEVRPEDKVLYCHTKGAYARHPANEQWRQTMDSRLIGPWRSRIRELDDYDLVGLHWLTPEEFGYRGVRSPFFGGNFWWARGDYLMTLPKVIDTEDRFAAEGWIGLGSPRVKDLSPGWPAYRYPSNS
jgi:hypothetical protein